MKFLLRVILLLCAIVTLQAFGQNTSLSIQSYFEIMKTAETATVFVLPPDVDFRTQLDAKTLMEVGCVTKTANPHEIAKLLLLLAKAKPTIAIRPSGNLVPQFEPRQMVLFQLPDGSTSKFTLAQSFSNSEFVDGEISNISITAQKSVTAELFTWAISHGVSGRLCKDR